jgi:hypothetical protein
MHCGGFVLNLPSQQGSRPTSYIQLRSYLPADVMWESLAVQQYDKGISGDSRRVDIDSLEEACFATLVQSTRYLEGIRCYHDRNVKERSSTLAI